MRFIVLTLVLVTGLESIGVAFDIPVPSAIPNALDSATNPSAVSLLGALIGGVTLAAALVVGGLWFVRKRKVTR
ncbi:MAG: hypothetical protein SFV81_30205 [Pirellulaceae bacterium]|nr:hypothetical protein [Pirellulaceae bacterium]